MAQAGAAVAQAGLAVGAAGLSSGNEDMARMGGGMAAVGGLVSLFASAAAEAAKPQADTRQWNNLPEIVLYDTYRVDPGTGTAGVSHMAGRMNEGGDAHCRVAWSRHPATPL